MKANVLLVDHTEESKRTGVIVKNEDGGVIDITVLSSYTISNIMALIGRSFYGLLSKRVVLTLNGKQIDMKHRGTLSSLGIVDLLSPHLGPHYVYRVRR
jgi:hypothetical protein